jgi:predicted MFS family arabinose efflux permease
VTDAPVSAGPDAARAARRAVLLLGWVAGITSTGICLSAVSLAPATEDLGLGPLLRSAVAAAPSLAMAATAVAAGVAADRLGRRRLLSWSCILAAVACLAVVVVPAGPVYLAGVAAAGVAYGVMLTGTYAYLTAVAPPGGLGRAIGLWGTSSILIGTAASLAGGLLADVHWRLLFLVVPAMCVPAVVLLPRLLPPMPRTRGGRVDVCGLLLMGLGLALLVTGLLAVAASPRSPVTWALCAGAAALLAGWVLVERRRPDPAFPVRLFRSRLFVGGVLAGLLVNGAYAAPVISLSDYLQYEKQGSVLLATLGLQPFYLIGAVAWFVAGRQLSSGRSPRAVMILGALVAAVGFVTLLPLKGTSAYWVILPGSLLIGYGTNVALTGQAQVFLDAAPPEAFGAVTGSKLTIGQLGYSVGMIVTTLLLSGLTARGVLHGLTGQGMSAADASATLSTLNGSFLSGQPPKIADLSQVLGITSTAFTAAFRARMLVGAAAMVVTATVVWVLLRVRPAD